MSLKTRLAKLEAQVESRDQPPDEFQWRGSCARAHEHWAHWLAQGEDSYELALALLERMKDAGWTAQDVWEAIARTGSRRGVLAKLEQTRED